MKCDSANYGLWVGVPTRAINNSPCNRCWYYCFVVVDQVKGETTRGGGGSFSTHDRQCLSGGEPTLLAK